MNNVVKISVKDGVALVLMEDKDNNNMFTKELMDGLSVAFSDIESRQDIKVVVLSGYEKVFSAGGTKDELLKINSGELCFTDISLYDLILNCEIPVIAAMQGHALGGGLAFGCYADIIILAEEAIYSANFMNYGFTPGFGSTYIIPQKLGVLLGNEMLFTARNYFGREIKEMNAGTRIIKSNKVLDKALEIAYDLADKPRLSLIQLKNHLSQDVKLKLPGVIEQEIKMHDLTFGQEEVRRRICEKI